jgi:ADP-heptose:LPS heptosyltransferase
VGLRIRPQAGYPAQMRRLLVLRALGLGDLLVAVPALRGLRRRYPDHHLVLAAPPSLSGLARRTGAVDEILPTNAPGALTWPYALPPDIAVNLHGRGPQSHAALDATGPMQRIGLRAPGWDGPEWAAIAREHPHERQRWCAVVEAFGVAADPSEFALGVRHPAPAGVVIHPGAAYGAKRWPADRFADLARKIDDEHHRVVVTGSADEQPLARRVAQLAGLPPDRVLAGATDVVQLADLVAGAALVVCGDTGVAHLATAFRTPSIVLFGPVASEQWGPPEDGPHVVLTDASARRGEPFADDPDPALLGVGAADVLTLAFALLARHGVAALTSPIAKAAASR